MDNQIRFQYSNTISYTCISHSVFILHEKSRNYFLLENISAEIWDMVPKYDFGTMCRILSEKYKQSMSVIEQDISELIDELLECGVIVGG